MLMDTGSSQVVMSACCATSRVIIYVVLTLLLLLLLLLVLLLQVGFFDDKVGPITLAAIVMVTHVAITIMAFIDVLS